MSKKGILADMNYCTGCHACEVACKQENGYPVGISGIKITEIIMEDVGAGRVHFDYVPYFSKNCNLCAPRIASGEDTRPACVKHCGTASLHYGDIEELAKEMASVPRSILYSPK
jgi:Fe-S-cluster-containing dehydrogenase component